VIQSSPETCTSPAADWETTLSLYTEQRLTKIYRSKVTIRIHRALLNHLWPLYGWAGLLHADPREIATKYYQYLNESQRRKPVTDAVNVINEFRRWYSKEIE
jgi:hypothetical protein